MISYFEDTGSVLIISPTRTGKKPGVIARNSTVVSSGM